MRIRRRPQPSSSLLQEASSDPTTSAAAAQAPPQNAARDNRERAEEGKPRPRAGVDLAPRPAVARRLALPPEDDNVVGCGSRSMGAQRGADDAYRSCGLANGHRSWDRKDGSGRSGGAGGKSEAKAEAEAGADVSNGVLRPAARPPVAAVVAVKEEAGSGSGRGGGGGKRRRGPAALVDGSGCSRRNGRGWRCGQPTLAGYALCEHHLGKGRMRSAAAAAAARAAQHGARTMLVPAAPSAEPAASLRPGE